MRLAQTMGANMGLPETATAGHRVGDGMEQAGRLLWLGTRHGAKLEMGKQKPTSYTQVFLPVLHQRNCTGRWPVFVGLVSTRTYLRHEAICSALLRTEIRRYMLRRRPLCMGDL